jgi:flagellar basal body L-ring protein FlgH
MENKYLPSKKPQKSGLSDATAKKVADVLHVLLNEKKKAGR